LGVDYQGGCAHLDIEDGWPWNWGLVYLLVSLINKQVTLQQVPV